MPPPSGPWSTCLPSTRPDGSRRAAGRGSADPSTPSLVDQRRPLHPLGSTGPRRRAPALHAGGHEGIGTGVGELGEMAERGSAWMAAGTATVRTPARDFGGPTTPRPLTSVWANATRTVLPSGAICPAAAVRSPHPSAATRRRSRGSACGTDGRTSRPPARTPAPPSGPVAPPRTSRSAPADAGRVLVVGILSSFTAVFSTARSSRYAFAAIVAETPAPGHQVGAPLPDDGRGQAAAPLGDHAEGLTA